MLLIVMTKYNIYFKLYFTILKLYNYYIYVVRSPYRRNTVIHRRKNNCVTILINFIQYQPI